MKVEFAKMNSDLRWEDLRVILAIYKSGSLSGAARVLEVSHATVFRRLQGIESRIGASLFERHRSGYEPTLAGEDLAQTAERVELEILGAERRVMGRDLKLSGTIRVTTTDTLLSGMLSPIFHQFGAHNPEICLEVVVSNRVFNLSKRDADVAVRPSISPPDHLVGRLLGRITMAIYGSVDLVPDKTDDQEISRLQWIGPDSHMGYPALEKWMEDHSYHDRCRYRVDSLLAMLWAAREGAGLAVLPCYLAENDAGLRRLGDPVPELETDLWILTHPDLRNVMRIRRFLDHIGESVRGQELITPPGKF
ncbi:LysR family transcriptional regulator [Hahella ganghwensis]|uniref:LysR family transcriptional regulator n=1 Tax=Hahella ganghwensis TaxID=286420 RepID=UPI0003604ADC|nr:LysR family transcriptional regulator [Hahella ganghwensis]